MLFNIKCGVARGLSWYVMLSRHVILAWHEMLTRHAVKYNRSGMKTRRLPDFVTGSRRALFYSLIIRQHISGLAESRCADFIPS
jgi:hypothetical protein